MLREASPVPPANAMQYAVIRSNEFNSMFLFNTAKLLAAGSKASTRTAGLRPAYKGESPDVGAYIPKDCVVGECVNPFHRVGFLGLKPGYSTMGHSQIWRKKQEPPFGAHFRFAVLKQPVSALCYASALRMGLKNRNVTTRANTTMILANSVLMAFWVANSAGTFHTLTFRRDQSVGADTYPPGGMDARGGRCVSSSGAHPIRPRRRLY